MSCGMKVQLWYHSVSFLPAVAEYLAVRPQAGTGDVGMPGSLLFGSENPLPRGSVVIAHSAVGSAALSPAPSQFV